MYRYVGGEGHEPYGKSKLYLDPTITSQSSTLALRLQNHGR